MKKLILILLAAMALLGCDSKLVDKKQNEKIKTLSIKELKNIVNEKNASFSKETIFEVEGYFVNEPAPMIISDLKLLLINSPLPESEYILLSGKAIDKIKKNYKKFYGAQIKIKGSVNILKTRKSINNFELICPEFPIIVNPRLPEIKVPGLSSICDRYPKICDFKPTPLNRNVALLYSGGINNANAHSRYWNDLKFMYLTLRNKYGYSKENIIVVYKEGEPEDSEMEVDYPASYNGFEDAFNEIGSKLSSKDNFFVFITNHGGGYHEENERNEGGRVDITPIDEIDKFKYDESIFYFGENDNKLWDDHLKNKIDCLNFKRLIGVFEPCFSGGLLRDLSGKNRILVSACTEFEYSWGGGPGNHDEFSYYFTSALNEADHLGNSIDSDSNNDGKISILEAFDYAKANDSMPETPMLEDSGNGAGLATPSTTVEDGSVADIVYL